MRVIGNGIRQSEKLKSARENGKKPHPPFRSSYAGLGLLVTQDANIKLVLDYFQACNTGDIADLKATLKTDVVHYFLPSIHPPIIGADHLAKYWNKFQKVYNPSWKIDNAIASDDEVVSEWSCAYTLPSNGNRMIFRGTEWYVIKNQRISEVRAYYHYDETKDCQLNGFPYVDRRYLQK